jgi:O-antigen ligase
MNWIYGSSIAFIAINSLFIANEYYWFSLVPFLLGLLFLYLFSLDKVLLLITFLTPLSVNVEFENLGATVSLPTEPLMAAVLLLFIFKLFFDLKIDKNFLKHPVTICIFLYLVWILFTSITSKLPLISFKYFIAKLWFIIPFYVLGVLLFKKFKNIKIFTGLYIISLLFVIVYTIINHAKWNFTEQPAHWVMTPFYNDHTSYGALIAMFIPISLNIVFDKSCKRSLRFIAVLISIILIIAIILSYSRAAWLSLIAAAFALLLILIKFKVRYLLYITGFIIILFFSFQNEIINKLEKNKQDSSANLVEHVQSIYNISSDASNLERINRWQAAIRMFKEKPLVGWGPGTYQFIYAPYQYSKDKTIISTNAGDKGNAHSEYISPLCEEGILGLLLFLSIIVSVTYTAIKVFRKSVKKKYGRLALVYLLGLITYYTHGLLNNFLDTDKASVPFWGFTAIIVALDIYYKTNNENLTIETENNIINSIN